jgi:hypothetical protein
VHGPYYIRLVDPLYYRPAELLELVGHGVADRVGDIQRGRPALDGESEHIHQKVYIGAARVLRGKLHIWSDGARKSHGALHLFQHVGRLHFQLVLHVDRACGYECVYPRTGRAAERLPGRREILLDRAGETGDDRKADLRRDTGNRLEVAARCRRETCLYYIDIEALQGVCYLNLLPCVQVDAGCLLSVPHSSVENSYDIVSIVHG